MHSAHCSQKMRKRRRRRKRKRRKEEAEEEEAGGEGESDGEGEEGEEAGGEGEDGGGGKACIYFLLTLKDIYAYLFIFYCIYLIHINLFLLHLRKKAGFTMQEILPMMYKFCRAACKICLHRWDYTQNVVQLFTA